MVHKQTELFNGKSFEIQIKLVFYFPTKTLVVDLVNNTSNSNVILL